MANDEKGKAAEEAGYDKGKPFIVSRVVIDEKTGTVTLKLASEEEIKLYNEQKTKKVTPQFLDLI
jgi:hypothetical protein